MDLPIRPRRNRRTPVLRGWSREARLDPERLILPLFLHAGTADLPIRSMPGCLRLSPAGLLREVEGALEDGIRSVVLFPAIDEAAKSPGAEEAYREDGLYPTTIRGLKRRFPELTIVTDVAPGQLLATMGSVVASAPAEQWQAALDLLRQLLASDEAKAAARDKNK